MQTLLGPQAHLRPWVPAQKKKNAYLTTPPISPNCQSTMLFPHSVWEAERPGILTKGERASGLQRADLQAVPCEQTVTSPHVCVWQQLQPPGPMPDKVLSPSCCHYGPSTERWQHQKLSSAIPQIQGETGLKTGDQG